MLEDRLHLIAIHCSRAAVIVAVLMAKRAGRGPG